MATDATKCKRCGNPKRVLTTKKGAAFAGCDCKAETKQTSPKPSAQADKPKPNSPTTTPPKRRGGFLTALFGGD